jgi:D-alanyl-D-alanine carboxypeptidase
MIRHIFLLLLIAASACSQTGGAFFGTFAQPPSPSFSIEANYGAVIDGETGQLMWGKSEHTTHMMASTTKIWTLVTALVNCNDLSHQVTISATADAQTGTNASLIAGAVFTMNELLYAMMMPSGNDAAWAIAEHVGGTAHLGGSAGNEVSTFVTAMDALAATHNLTHTNFNNPHGGLDADAANHYACAYDMARMARILLNLDPAITVPAIGATVVARSRWKGTCVSCNGSNVNVWYNGSVLNCTINGGIGVKSGSTAGSGTHHVGAARRNGRTIITASLNGTAITANHRPMMDFGFQSIGLHGYPSSSNCQERASAIVYAGTWTHSTTSSADFDQDYHSFSNTTDSTATMEFVGNGIEWWSTKSTSRGITEVSIDSVVVGNVDAWNGTTIPSAAVYQNLTLPWGTHTIQLRVTGTKNGSASDFITSVDAFKVYQ